VKATKTILVTAAALTTILASTNCQANDGSRADGMFRTPVSAEFIFRGQSPDAGGVPLPNGAAVSDPAAGSVVSPGYVADPAMGYNQTYPGTTTWNAFSPPVMPDPFVGQPGYGAPGTPYAPYSPYQAPGMAPAPSGFAYGANAAAPYRFGWTNRLDVSWQSRATAKPKDGVSPTGKVSIFGLDYDLAYSTPYVPGWIVNWTNQFAYRNWDGPTTTTVSQPSNFYRFAFDLELETPKAGPYSVSLGVTPSLNTDFNANVWDEGFLIDGRGIVFLHLDQFWTIGLGAMYWNRVDDLVIPYAGLIYRDDYWEWQLMWPEARISLFLGNEAYWSKWLYARGEYNVEAYGIKRNNAGVKFDDRMQVTDYRILIGMKMDSGFASWFFEGGWVLERDVKFRSSTPGYDIASGFIGQIGVRY
jgi:hypothetical protein